MQAMLIPPLPFEAPDGIRIYPEEPAVQDQKTDRGDFVFGRRIQVGKVPHPEGRRLRASGNRAEVVEPDDDRLVMATQPAVHFTEAANPGYVTELPPEPEPVAVAQPKHVSLWARYKFWIQVVAPCCIVGLVVLWIARRYLPRLLRRLQAWRLRREQSEGAYFASVSMRAGAIWPCRPMKGF
jgi:hypothetical protein